MLQIAEKRNLFLSWIKWRYLIQLKEILVKWRNVVFFIFNYFSLFLLLRTYLSPWRRYRWSYGRGFDLGRYAEAALANTFSRLIGAFVRTFVIVACIFCAIFVFICGLFIVLFWILIPFLIIALLCLTLS